MLSDKVDAPSSVFNRRTAGDVNGSRCRRTLCWTRTVKCWTRTVTMLRSLVRRAPDVLLGAGLAAPPAIHRSWLKGAWLSGAVSAIFQLACTGSIGDHSNSGAGDAGGVSGGSGGSSGTT